MHRSRPASKAILESDVPWRVADRVTLGADLGLLQTHFEDFVQQGASVSVKFGAAAR